MGYGFFDDESRPLPRYNFNPLAQEIAIVRSAILLAKVALIILFLPLIAAGFIIWITLRIFLPKSRG